MPVSDLTFVADSGLNYTEKGIVPVPEPSYTFLEPCLAMLLAASFRRRKRRVA